jgi:hypothetical protein
MKKLIMFMIVGFMVPMFGVRPVLKYGDINPITGRVVQRYEQNPIKAPQKPVRVNKGRLIKTDEEEEIFTPEERKMFMQEEEILPEARTSFVDESGRPLPPALPRPSASVRPSKQLRASDLSQVKLKPVSQVQGAPMIEVPAHKAPVTFEGTSSATRPSMPITGESLSLQKEKLKKIPQVGMSHPKSPLQTSLEGGLAKRRLAIEPEEEEQQYWD